MSRQSIRNAKPAVQNKPYLKNETEAAAPLKSPSLNRIESPKPSFKTKIVLEPEPRKMQAERPVLLQDLSQSRLLQKFKQETEGDKKEDNSEKKKEEEEVKKSDTSPKKQSNDGYGIYGADITSLDTKPIFTVPQSNKTSPIKQNKEEHAPHILVNNEQADEIEKVYLENATKEINGPSKETTITPKKSIIKNVDHDDVSHHVRKPAFNPLHVILKDKNKYHTTEYI